jgi:L-ascorbate metabolism protein UlaG (beta-lactamase superfamily)
LGISPRRAVTSIAIALTIAACAHPPISHVERYYAGPVSDHFDGRRFFNPDGEQGTGGQQHEKALGFVEQAFGKGQHHAWPAVVPIARSVPPARVAGERMLVTWIGHSTVLIQTQSLNILLDPVWAERDSPIPFVGPRRVRAPGVRLRDLPRIDLVLISHDHYDHLDLGTLKMLWDRDRPLVLTGLGNDALLTPHGVRAVALDWGQSRQIAPGVEVTLRRAHHWSAHGLHDHDMALWTGFTLTLPSGGDLYYAGDTGPGDMRWATEARAGRPVRLAILPIGAIKLDGEPSGNHIAPEQAVTAFEQLGAAYALGVHWGTFELTSEPINAPPELLEQALRAHGVAKERFRTVEAGEAWDVPVAAPSR